MTPEQYAVAAQRTLTSNYYPELIDAQRLELDLGDFIAVARQIDKSKKAGFYGKGSAVKTPVQFTGNPIYLHALLGICSEAGELAENAIDAFNEVHINEANAKEELGDLLWFIQAAAHSLNTSIPELMAMNIRKLQSRYPEKFTEENALNRDIDAEMLAMTGGRAIDV